MNLPLFFQILIDVCLPLFAVVGVGWFMDRRFGLNLETLVKVNLYLLVPGFVFVRLLTAPMSGAEAGRIMGVSLGVILLSGVLAFTICRFLALKPGSSKALALASMFGNCGNFGLPLVTLAFGQAAASVQVYVLVTMNISTFTMGLLLANAGDGRPGSHWRALMSTLRQPAIYAVLTAGLCKWIGLHPETISWLWNPLSMMADALVGIALLTLGVQLSKTKPAPVKLPLISALTLRLLIAPLMTWGITSMLGFDRATAAVMILTSGAPTAVNTALLAHEFGGDTSFATASVYYSTLLSLLTTTLTLTVLRVWIA